MNGMNKIILTLLIISIAIASIGFASASDMNDTSVTDSTFDGEMLNVDDSFSDSVMDDVKSIEIDNISDSDIGANSTNESDIIKPPLNISGPKDPTSLDIKGPKISDPNLPGSFDDLQVEINNAKSGSVLHLHKDYNGKKGTVIQLNKDLTINGHGHTLDCLHLSDCSAFFSKSGNIVLKNLNIINGHNDDTDKGGAIHITGSAEYTLIGCKLIDNWADDFGGAIYNGVDNPLTIINCTFRGNVADDDDGGAIWSEGEVNIRNSTFDSNKACEDGGAIFCKQNVNVLNSVLKSNTAKGAIFAECYGGAIASKGDVYIDNSTVSDNTAGDYGGAVSANNIYVNTKVPNSKSFFNGNSALDDHGGAFYARNCVKVRNSVFSGNKACFDGGAINCKEAHVESCEFGFNNASGAIMSKCYGGAICAYNDLYLYSSVLHDNLADNYGGAVYTTTLYLARDKPSYIYDNYAADGGNEPNEYCIYRELS